MTAANFGMWHMYLARAFESTGQPGFKNSPDMVRSERARVTGMRDTRAHAAMSIGKVCGHHEVECGIIEELSK